MKPSTAEIQVKDLNHYGTIAGIIDEIGLVEKINDPLFFTSSVFLKSPRRVAALAMIMVLS